MSDVTCSSPNWLFMAATFGNGISASKNAVIALSILVNVEVVVSDQ